MTRFHFAEFKSVIGAKFPSLFSRGNMNSLGSQPPLVLRGPLEVQVYLLVFWAKFFSFQEVSN